MIENHVPQALLNEIEAITSDNYASAVVRTESPTDAPISRLTPEMVTLYLEAYRHVHLAGTAFDELKRHIFYGTPLKNETQRWLQAVGSAPRQSEEWLAATLGRFRDPRVVRLFHAAAGLQTETSEIHQTLFEHVFEGKDLDEVNVAEELGDVSWYVGLATMVLGRSLTQILRQNLRKLWIKRYRGGKFSEYDAVNRDLSAERKSLES